MATERAGRPNRPQTRLAALTVLLSIALALGAILAWQAVASGRQQRETAEQTLTDYADFAAFVLATSVYREFGLQVLSSFAALPPWNTPELFDSPSVASQCGADGFYFEYEPAGGELRLRDAAASPAALSHLRDTLVHSATLLDEASWRFRFIRLDLGNAGQGVFIAPATLAQGFGVRGFSSCMWEDSTIVDLMGRSSALPPALTGSTPPDSLYGVAIGDMAGVDLYLSRVVYPPRFQGASRLGAEYGDLVLKVTLNPDIAPGLVIGGIPASRLPSALGLLALNALLLFAAVMQLRREYRLIAVRSQFVSSVSHELRTPLSQILIFTDLLKLGRLRHDSERKRSLDIIGKETRRLIQLVENVLEFSHTSSVPEPVATDFELLPAVEETIDAFRPLADARDVILAVNVPPNVLMRANRNSLRQVLLNLLDNAVKYGPEGQTVRVEAVERNGYVELAVEDQGPGIPIEDRDRIWDGFQRLQRDTTSAVSGSGIGLSVVRSLVSRLGGRVHVTDSATGGSRFSVILPVGVREREQ